MASVESLQSFDHRVECARCGEKLIAPERSEYVKTEEVRNLWRCANCGFEFETSANFHADSPLPIELVEAFLPNLLVA
jgi:DNA-directed RNA polymerase subunit RPC12/RpoP